MATSVPITRRRALSTISAAGVAALPVAASASVLPETPQDRLARATQEYIAAAKAIDPTVTEWFEMTWAANGALCRFALTGSRKPASKAEGV